MKYADAKARIIRANELNICTRCLASGHSHKTCTITTTKCFYCQKPHYSYFCLKKDAEAGSKPKSKPQARTESRTVSFASSSETPNTSKADEVVGATLHPSGKNETVLFMCIRVQISNSSNPKKSVDANIFLDGMSFRTFMTEDLSQRLGLKPFDTEEFNIGVFGSDSAPKSTLSRVSFNVLTEFGEPIPMKGSVKKFLTMAAPASCLSPAEVDELLAKRKKAVKVEWLKPDLIIGMDNYHLLKVKDLCRLSDRLVLSESRLGPIISGPVELDSKSTS